MEISWNAAVDSTAVNEKRNLYTASNSKGKRWWWWWWGGAN